MLTTTNDRHDFLTVEDEPENKPGTFDYRDFGLDQKQIGPPVYEAVTSWSDEVAQTQEIGSLPPRQIATNSSPRTHTEKDAHSRFSSLEKVVQLLSMSVSPDAVVAVQDQNRYPSICYLMAGDIETCQCSTRSCRFTPRGRCLPLVRSNHSKHTVQSYEAMDRPVAQETTTSTKRVTAPGPAQSKKVDVSGVVQKTVEELLGTVVPNDAPLMGAGLDSLSAVDLVQTLGQKLGTELEPTALFDYPTIGSLTKYLAAQEEPEIPLVSESDDVVPVPLPTIQAGAKAIQECFVVATAMYLPTVERSFTNGDLQGMSHGRFETATLVPVTRWNMDSIDTRRFSADARSRVRYGSFLQSDFSMFDNTMFRISPAEARPLEPQ